MWTKKWMPLVVGLIAVALCAPVAWQVIQHGERLRMEHERFVRMTREPVVVEALVAARAGKLKGKSGVFLNVRKDGVQQVYVDADGEVGSIEMMNGEMLLPHPEAGGGDEWFGYGVLVVVFVLSAGASKGVVWAVTKYVQPRI